MRKILDNITSYLIKWWEGADKQFLFWGTVAVSAVAYSIWKNT